MEPVRKLKRGDVVLVQFPSSVPSGHEQEGQRPAIVVGIPLGVVRYPTVVVVPLTTQGGPWAKENSQVYPLLPAGSGQLKQDSIALLDQVRAVDVQRIVRYFGSLTAEDYAPIVEGLLQMIGRW
jgi:mRNA interferase MazF